MHMHGIHIHMHGMYAAGHTNKGLGKSFKPNHGSCQ